MGSTKCGYQQCLEDGTICVPGLSCYNCCNGAYDENGSKCGGTCLAEGTKCDFYTTCSLCCMSSVKFNHDTGSYECSKIDEVPLSDPYSIGSDNHIVLGIASVAP